MRQLLIHLPELPEVGMVSCHLFQPLGQAPLIEDQLDGVHPAQVFPSYLLNQSPPELTCFHGGGLLKPKSFQVWLMGNVRLGAILNTMPKDGLKDAG